MMDSVKTPYDKCIQTLIENIKLDPYFKEFIDWANENNVPVVVLSSGMEPIIRALLEHMVGKEAAKVIQIVSNNVEVRDGHKSINEEGGWKIVFHDESHFGHDKSLEIRPYANLPEDQRPTMFYAGDGVSDLSAAKETDLLFAKKGQGRISPFFSTRCNANDFADLVSYCVRENVPFTIFEDWSSILSTVKDIVAGKTTVKDVYAAGVEDFKQGGNEK
jgi:2,3-diketo-5-methylthio-1-phosphopentane phosphatase